MLFEREGEGEERETMCVFLWVYVCPVREERRGERGRGEEKGKEREEEGGECVPVCCERAKREKKKGRVCVCCQRVCECIVRLCVL